MIIPNISLNKKNSEVECLNTLFIFIVLYAHHGSYTHNYLHIFSVYGIRFFLIKFAVGGFLFLSGFKVAKSKSSDSVMTFFTKRISRIYWLYLISLLFFAFTAYPHSNDGAFPSFANNIKHVLCMQSIFPDLFGNIYDTLWFVSTLFSCYVFYIFTRKILEKSDKSFFAIVIITLFTILIFNYLGILYGIKMFMIDFNTYLCFFAFGMIFSKRKKEITALCNRTYFILFSVGFLGLLSLKTLVSVNTWYEETIQFILIYLSALPLYFIVFKNYNHFKFPPFAVNLFKIISFSSFCVFLFHRPIWTVMSGIWNDRSFFQWFYIVPFGITLIFTLSYFIQTSYNFILKKIHRNNLLRFTAN